jgi:hypothetical protein
MTTGTGKRWSAATSPFVALGMHRRPQSCPASGHRPTDVVWNGIDAGSLALFALRPTGDSSGRGGVH